MRSTFILIATALLAFSACSEKNYYEEDSGNDAKAQQMRAVGSLFENIAKQPEMADALIETTEVLAGYSNISELAPLDDEAVAERGEARGESIGLCFEAISRQPDMIEQLEELCVRFLGQSGDGIVSDELNRYSAVAAASSLNSSIARQPYLEIPLKSFADKVLGTSLGLEDNTLRLYTDRAVGDTIVLGLTGIGDIEVTGATPTGRQVLDYYTGIYRDVYELQSPIVSICGQLTDLYCSGNDITNLYFSKNEALERITCKENSLESVDISMLPNLRYADFSKCGLKEFDVSKNLALDSLNLYVNDISEIDLSNNANLTWLGINYNSLKELDVSANSKLELLICDGNELSQLDVSHNPELYFLSFGGNDISGIDLSKLAKLRLLYCTEGKLSSLDLSHNPLLETALLSSNRLTTLNISGLDKLYYLQIYGNKINASEMENIVNALPYIEQTDDSYGSMNVYCTYVEEENEMPQSLVKAANAKGWKVWALTKAGSQEFLGTDYVPEDSGGEIIE